MGVPAMTGIKLIIIIEKLDQVALVQNIIPHDTPGSPCQSNIPKLTFQNNYPEHNVCHIELMPIKGLRTRMHLANLFYSV
jgi:hypothetical protein